MKYTDLADSTDFFRNMRKTPWLRLFPHWWSERDPLLLVIGEEVEKLKALALFGLLNAGIKPPVMIWQESLKHEQYNINQDIVSLPAIVEAPAPFYKTWGDITLTNNTKDDIDGLEITFNDGNGYAINQLIAQGDIIKINLTDNKVQLNGHTIKPQILGKGMPYFLTTANNRDYKENTPLHNEIVRLKINTDTNLEDTVIVNTVNVTEKMDNWNVHGNAYQYNKKGQDPWIAIENNSTIEYDLDFTKITEISFWYMGRAGGTLTCKANGQHIFTKDIVDEAFHNYTINTKNIEYQHSFTDAITNENTTISDIISLTGLGTLEFSVSDTDDVIYINDIKYQEKTVYNTKCDINVDINMNNVVFQNEQNIEITGLELIPIEKVELYAKYNFSHNSSRNGWQKVYQKKYDSSTNVIYDMITTHFYTKEFYVDVWFKTLQYPYKVGFPCYQDASTTSEFHVNNRLDTWGKQLGLERRLYKTNIDEKDYPYTFPIYYPYDIEQDYWYYKRLISEYTWNDLAINDVDIKDTEGNNVLKLYSINPFCEDFVVHARSQYPKDKEFVDYNEYYPLVIKQQKKEGFFVQSEYNHLTNLLDNTNYYSSITLNNNSDNNDIIYKQEETRYRELNSIDREVPLTAQQISEIQESMKSNRAYMTGAGHISKELLAFFDLTNLPENVNIDDIIITIDAESTDNKTNKFSTEDTGLVIPDLTGEEEYFIPLVADKNYQLRKQSINYSIANPNDLQKIISGVDDNIIQKATIGAFQGRLHEYVRIPFELTENGTVVKDITEVWVYFDNVLKAGIIEKDENNHQYIKVSVPKKAIMSTMKIVCKCTDHMPFSTIIDINKMNAFKPIDENNEESIQEIDYQYITGPLVDGEPQTIEVQEEWHTKDIRNILQRQGIYFKNIFQNNDPQASTTILLYTIKLTIKYSQKSSNLHLNTYINVQDAVKPNVGIYEIEVKNIGERPVKTSIDIITPPNIHMEENYIDVDLNRGMGLTKKINIIPEYPIIDGFYDILTLCDDIIKKDTINVFSDGLIRTSVDIKPHSGKYNENIHLIAKINAIDGSKIHGSVNQVQFYINGYAVGDPVSVYYNTAETIITPGNYKFTGTGTLKLEARYLGNTKYASSRGKSSIFISKNSTKLTITAAPKSIYYGSYEAKAIVQYYDGEQYKPVNDGYVTFYLKNIKNAEATEEILGTAVNNDSNGVFVASIDKVENPPGDYKLIAKYEGSMSFASAKEEQDFEIIGGNVKVLVFDEVVRPGQKTKLRAKVLDENNKNVPLGYLDFKNEELDINIVNVPVIDGMGTTEEIQINSTLNDDDASKIYTLEVSYHGVLNDEEEIYKDAQGVGYITVKKGEVVIECSSIYQASQYEPLGFYLKIKDAETNEDVSAGTVTIILPGQNNLEIQADVDNDGGVRVVHNLINFTAKEWHELHKWSFSTANDNALGQVNTVNNTNINNFDGIYNADNLYKIYDGNYKDITLVDFTLDETGQYLIYEGKQRNDNDTINIKEYVFIGDDGCLYARTDIDELRKYITGLQNIKIKYHDTNGEYKTQIINIDNGLNIDTQNVDLDIHSYDLTYTDTDSIVCYATKYDIDQENIPVTDGSVQFIFDNKTIDTVDVVDGKAFFHNELLTNIEAGKHLLEVDYIKNNNKTTRSYSLFNLRQAVPVLTISTNRITRNKNTTIAVNVNGGNNNIPLNGIVNLYLEHDGIREKIGEQYLYGNEILSGIVDYEGHITNDLITDTPHVLFNYIMPADIDIPDKYTLIAIYEGNEYFSASEPCILPIYEQPADVTIDSEDVDISNNIKIGVNEECNIDFVIESIDDVIDEGVLYLMAGTEIIASSHVVNNIATLSWTPEEIKHYSFELKYDDAIHYNMKNQVINFDCIAALDEISLPNTDYKTLKQALMCIKTDGIIYLNSDIELKKSLTIKKDCFIVGSNDIKIINASNKEINITNNNKLHINNIHFVSDNYLMQIINKKYLVINHSILDENIQLHNDDYLMAQRNFIYGVCTGNNSDLNNNWWGSNTPKYNVDSHIIITVESLNSPAVISEEINIIGKMISSNGREYDLPEANFTFGADSGYFSVDFGKTVNHQIQTTYIDAEKEGNIYFTVDKETVLCPVYEYERKTEVIIDEFTEIPLNYQIPITAKVQSCADLYYEFDSSNNIIDNSKSINEGYMSFYINNEQVGYVPVINGQATTMVFFTNKYYENTTYQLKAQYIPKDYYFASENSTTFSVINDNDVCYVSATGDDNNDGKYNTPVKSIQHAINLHKNAIYLLDDNYTDTTITINYNTIIKSFKNHTTFDSLSGNYLFNIKPNMLLKCINIDFTNNQLTTIFNNQGSLNLYKCILYKNKKIIVNTNGEIDIRYSAIVDNTQIASDIDASWFTYCWFGENNPNIDGIDNHIQMNIEASKDILYIGTLAHISGLLNEYKRGMLKYKLEEPLPLRIAKFATTYGSMKPIKDYTYNNKSISLLNTQEDNNTSRYIISIPENKNYINDTVKLSCTVRDVYGNNASGQVKMDISRDNLKIQRTVSLNNGIATTNIDNKLNIGVYNLTCSYYDGIKYYESTKKFIVQKPEIIVKAFDILEGSNLYYSRIYIELEDNLGNKINDQMINIKIDDEYIATVKVNNGIINKKIAYKPIPQGGHILSIDNDNNGAEYETFKATKSFNTIMKNINTQKEVIFDYDNFEVGVSNNVSVYIVDDEGNNVNGGYITVELDNHTIVSKAEVINGNVPIKNFLIEEIGQHTISIYYSGLENYYNEALFINSYIGAGIFNVIFGLDKNQYIHADIGKPLHLSTTITDTGKQSVNHGYVNAYIDDILLNEEPIYINNGVFNIQTDLPENITSGLHNFKLEYIDVTDTYLDTFFTTFLEVGKIPTTINMDTIYGAPNQHTTINYQISTAYGNVSSGILVAKYEDNVIGHSIVTDNILNQITIKVPFLPETSDYDIVFEYTDEYYYADSTLTNRLIIRKNDVNIQPSHTQYYPSQLFHFIATITDQEGNRINNGQAALYIDNVKETESQDVINGQIIIPLLLNKARKYPMSIVYEDNDYYNQTIYSFTFNVDSVDINTIYLKEDNTHQPSYYIDDNHILHSLPNQNIDAELIFDTPDNYNVKDGIIEIKIDDTVINTFHVAESNKYINFNTDNLSKGKHTLTLKYHSSSLFNDYEKTFALDILSKNLILTINHNNTLTARNHKSDIEIRTLIYDMNNQPINITGLIKYYIGLPIYKANEVGDTLVDTYDYHFIGVQQIDNTNENIYLYQLPTDLLEYAIDKYETNYKIKAEFDGNDEYNAASTEVDLHIEKENCYITFDNIGNYNEDNGNLIYNNYFITNYRETIDFNFNIDAEGSPLINFYIDDVLIGSTIAHNKQGSFTYKLDNKYTVKQGTDYYTLCASFNGSAVDRPTNTYIKMQINPLMPRIDNSSKTAYYGGILKLDNIITDVDNTIITDGTLAYTIGDNHVTYNVNERGQIDMPFNDNMDNHMDLHVVYDTDNSNYSVFEKDIRVNFIKNDINLDITAPNEIYRGQNYKVVVKATSETTNIPINIEVNGTQMTEGQVTIPLNYSASQSYAQSYDFVVSSPGNQFFNSVEKTITIDVANHDIITLDKNQALSDTNAQTLEKAIDLVSRYGTIQVINPPSNQVVTIDKEITIEGEDIDITNWQITNNSTEVLIEGLNFKNSTENAIINNGEAIISQCSFNGGNDSAIYSNGGITVLNCTFTNNQALNGAGVYIDNRNNKTLISNCIFKRNTCTYNQNVSSGNGSCIYLNKGNDVEISYNVFKNNNGVNNITSSIWMTGNAYISENSFYNNDYECEIYLINGTLSMDNNIFDGNIQSVKGYNGQIDADLNYWGYNDIDKIESHNSNLITLNNWLISRREDYNKEINGQSSEIVVGVIDQYINRLEKEITSINRIEKDFPVNFGTAPNVTEFKLNQEIKGSSSVPITIGQEKINKVN